MKNEKRNSKVFIERHKHKDLNSKCASEIRDHNTCITSEICLKSCFVPISRLTVDECRVFLHKHTGSKVNLLGEKGNEGLVQNYSSEHDSNSSEFATNSFKTVKSAQNNYKGRDREALKVDTAKKCLGKKGNEGLVKNYSSEHDSNSSEFSTNSFKTVKSAQSNYKGRDRDALEVDTAKKCLRSRNSLDELCCSDVAVVNPVKIIKNSSNSSDTSKNFFLYNGEHDVHKDHKSVFVCHNVTSYNSIKRGHSSNRNIHSENEDKPLHVPSDVYPCTKKRYCVDTGSHMPSSCNKTKACIEPLSIKSDYKFEKGQNLENAIALYNIKPCSVVLSKTDCTNYRERELRKKVCNNISKNVSTYNSLKHTKSSLVQAHTKHKRLLRCRSLQKKSSQKYLDSKRQDANKDLLSLSSSVEGTKPINAPGIKSEDRDIRCGYQNYNSNHERTYNSTPSSSSSTLLNEMKNYWASNKYIRNKYPKYFEDNAYINDLNIINQSAHYSDNVSNSSDSESEEISANPPVKPFYSLKGHKYIVDCFAYDNIEKMFVTIQDKPLHLKKPIAECSKCKRKSDSNQKYASCGENLKEVPESSKKFAKSRENLRKEPEPSQKYAECKKNLGKEPKSSYLYTEHKVNLKNKPLESSQQYEKYKEKLKNKPELSSISAECKDNLTNKPGSSQKYVEYKKNLKNKPKLCQKYVKFEQNSENELNAFHGTISLSGTSNRETEKILLESANPAISFSTSHTNINLIPVSNEISPQSSKSPSPGCNEVPFSSDEVTNSNTLCEDDFSDISITSVYENVKNNQCVQCCYVFSNRKDAYNHTCSGKRQKGFLCMYCERILSSYKKFKIHNRKVHEIS